MSLTVVNPLDERPIPEGSAPPRLASVGGARIALLDISKGGGSIFLDRVEHLLKQRYGASEVLRFRKPTFAKPAPEAVLTDIRKAQPHAVIEALAD